MGQYSPDGAAESSGFERGPTGATGEQGPPGPTGPQGAPGAQGPYGSAAYVEEFAADTVWIVNHNLGRHPHTWAVESLGNVEIDAAVQHVTPNQSRVYFDAPIAGRVRFT